MTWGLVAVAGATLVTGAVGAKGAKDAAKSQERTGQAGIADAKEARDDFNRRTEPFRQLGLSAADPLANLLGLSPQAPQQGQTEIARPEHASFGFDGPLQDVNVVPSAFSGAGQPPQSSQPPMLDEINPLVSFLRNEGFEDIQESAAAKGRLNAGGTLKDLTQFNTDLASTVAPQLQQQRFNQLFSTLGLGANAATGQGTAAMNTAVNTGNLLQGIGNARAQGTIGQANAISSGIGDLAGLYGLSRAGGFGGASPPPPVQVGGTQNPNLFAGFA